MHTLLLLAFLASLIWLVVQVFKGLKFMYETLMTWGAGMNEYLEFAARIFLPGLATVATFILLLRF